MKESKTLIIIPDVHGRGFWRRTVAYFPGAEFIFLGDYLDPYEDEGITDDEAFDKAYGSMIWADLDEQFKQENQIPDIVQVFGHTRVGGPISSGKFYCLDCSSIFALERENGWISHLILD